MLRLSRMIGGAIQAPDFALPGTDGRLHRLEDFAQSPALLVAFVCNHCPFVQHILPAFVRFAREYRPRGLATVAISANDPAEHPEDSPEHMAALAARMDFSFSYLFDEDQSVALAYNAICTPDFFLFGPKRSLFYSGQFDDSRPKIDRPPVPGMAPLRTDLPVTGHDMRRAVEALLGGEPAPQPQRPSAGCSIKWREDRAPAWG